MWLYRDPFLAFSERNPPGGLRCRSMLDVYKYLAVDYTKLGDEDLTKGTAIGSATISCHLLMSKLWVEEIDQLKDEKTTL